MPSLSGEWSIQKLGMIDWEERHFQVCQALIQGNQGEQGGTVSLWVASDEMCQG